MKYAGIGSRETPVAVLQRMEEWARWFAIQQIKLRSGRAAGADTAFEVGHNGANMPRCIELYVADDARNRPDWQACAALYHPAWEKCSPNARLLHSRNCPIMLGNDLLQPVDFVCCWTKDGKASGGTGQALRIANAYRIPVFNWFFDDCEDRLREFLTPRVRIAE